MISILKELLPPPKGKTGWPWTIETPLLADTMPDGRPWPKISIVTANYNYGRFIEKTIRSVLLQGYPNLEYIIIDGGSTDNSLKIIKKYEKWLTFWTSEKDSGQSQAINKGFSKAKGEIFAWLNSDDWYEPGALMHVAREFSIYPDASIISGRTRLWRGKSDDIMTDPSTLRSYEDFLCVNEWWTKSKFMIQPETFFRRDAYESCGGLSEKLQVCMDMELWIRMAKNGFKFHSFSKHLANYRIHKQQKSNDIYVHLLTVCRIAWENLAQDWDRFGRRALFIANDILSAIEQLHTYYYQIRDSTSYRIGRYITRLRFWRG